MNKFRPKIEWRDPATLIDYANNAKAHPQEQIDKIAASIAAFGFDQPISIDADGVIIKGHGRKLASLKLGLSQVPCVVRDDLTEAEVKAARIADNKTAESAWIEEKLWLEIKDLELKGFDVELTGFSEGEIAALAPEEDEGPEPPPEPEPEIPITPELMEAHNYVVLYFDNELDWQVAEEIFQIGPAKTPDSREGYQRIGTGRVIPGKDILAKLQEV